jgi:hypothetical protein
MYEIPSQPDVRRCIVNAAVVRGESPVLRETSLPYGAGRFAPPEFGPDRGTEGVTPGDRRYGVTGARFPSTACRR